MIHTAQTTKRPSVHDKAASLTDGHSSSTTMDRSPFAADEEQLEAAAVARQRGARRRSVARIDSGEMSELELLERNLIDRRLAREQQVRMWKMHYTEVLNKVDEQQDHIRSLRTSMSRGLEERGKSNWKKAAVKTKAIVRFKMAAGVSSAEAEPAPEAEDEKPGTHFL